MSKNVWVQILVKIDGAYPGDWLNINQTKARMWLAEGKCCIPRDDTKQSVLKMANCSVILRGGNIDKAKVALGYRYPTLDIVPDFLSPRVLLWDTSLNLDLKFIPIGFGLLLKGWQMAVPLIDYDLLARDIGTEKDKGKTEDLLHDLRVPVYDTRLIFAKRCKATSEFLKVWEEEGHDGLAFLRALHRVKPIINALPPFWVGNK